MILVDTNLLLYATLTDASEHGRARSWLEQRLGEGEGRVVLCWPVLYALVRLVTSPRVLGPHAVGVREAWAAAAALIEHPSTRVVTAGPRHGEIAAELAVTPGLRSEDVPDIEIAALAIEHGLVVASHDRGFRRFSGVRTVDPLD